MRKEFLLLEHMLIILDISVEGGHPTGLEKVAELQSVRVTLFLSVKQYVNFHDLSDKIFSFVTFCYLYSLCYLVFLSFHIQFITEAIYTIVHSSPTCLVSHLT
jgi:hypothetical protein